MTREGSARCRWRRSCAGRRRREVIEAAAALVFAPAEQIDSTGRLCRPRAVPQTWSYVDDDEHVDAAALVAFGDAHGRVGDGLDLGALRVPAARARLTSRYRPSPKGQG